MRCTSSLAFAIFQLAAAIPPACLLGALNSGQQNLADVQTICSKHASDVQSAISSMCGDSMNAALSSFHDTCKEHGVSVASYTATSSNSGGGQTGTGSKTIDSHTTTVPETNLLMNSSTSSNSSGTAGGANASSAGNAAAQNVAGSLFAILAGLAAIV